MTMRRLLTEDQLRVQCPHCGNTEEDQLEVLDQRVLESFTCAACASTFHGMVLECEYCAAECSICWPTKPTAQEVGLLACTTCGRNYFEDEPARIESLFGSDA